MLSLREVKAATSHDAGAARRFHVLELPSPRLSPAVSPRASHPREHDFRIRSVAQHVHEPRPPRHPRQQNLEVFRRVLHRRSAPIATDDH